MKIEHAAIYFNDLEKAKVFLKRILTPRPTNSTTIQEQDFAPTFIVRRRRSPRNHEQRTNGRLAKTTQPDRLGPPYFSLGSKEAVDQLTQRLKNDGYEVISGPRTTGDGYYESCILCFENNQIEISE